jgi:hypothetical protein
MTLPKLIDQRMHDGSRHFVFLPESKSSGRLLLHLAGLFGALPTAYVPSMLESWIDFRYKGHKFSINTQMGDYWFFVQDPNCPEEILLKVASHFHKLLN